MNTQATNTPGHRSSRTKSITGFAAGVALGLASLDAAAQAQTTYTYFAAEGTAPAFRAEFSTAADVNSTGEVVGTSFEWVPPSTPTLVAPPIAGFTQTFPIRAVNDLGAMTGTAEFPDTDSFSAYVRQNGVTTPIGTGLGAGSRSVGTDINNQGEIVGFRRSGGTFNNRAFLFRDGAFTDLGSLAGRRDDPDTNTAEANAVNANTQIVGQATDRRGRPRAFLWADGRMTNLGTLSGRRGFVRSSADGINDLGHVVGWSEARGATRRAILPRQAFVWRGGRMEGLGTLGGALSEANDINNAGVIVGEFESTVVTVTNDLERHAAVWVNGQGVDLNAPGVVTNLPDDITLEAATAVNDSGVIVGHTCSRQCAPGKSRFGKPFALIPNN